MEMQIFPAFFAPKHDFFYQPTDSESHKQMAEFTTWIPIENEIKYKHDF
jgi:hypothetical protein